MSRNLSAGSSVTLYPTLLEFHAVQRGEILTEIIIVKNLYTRTKLQGIWKIAPHSGDRPQSSRLARYSDNWIFIKPKRFCGNRIKCQIGIDTSELMNNKVYERQLILCTNLVPETLILPIRVQTGPEIQTSSINTLRLSIAWLVACGMFSVWLTQWLVTGLFSPPYVNCASSDLFDAGSCVNFFRLGAWACSWVGAWIGFKVENPVIANNGLADILLTSLRGLVTSLLLCILFTIVTFGFGWLVILTGLPSGLISTSISRMGLNWGNIIFLGFESISYRKAVKDFSFTLLLLGANLAIVLGIGINNPFVQTALAISAIPLTWGLIPVWLELKGSTAKCVPSKAGSIPF